MAYEQDAGVFAARGLFGTNEVLALQKHWQSAKRRP